MKDDAIWIKVKPKYSKEEFLRGAWYSIAIADPPEDVFNSTISVSPTMRFYSIIEYHLDISYEASVGFRRPYANQRSINDADFQFKPGYVGTVHAEGVECINLCFDRTDHIDKRCEWKSNDRIHDNSDHFRNRFLNYPNDSVTMISQKEFDALRSYLIKDDFLEGMTKAFFNVMINSIIEKDAPGDKIRDIKFKLNDDAVIKYTYVAEEDYEASFSYIEKKYSSTRAVGSDKLLLPFFPEIDNPDPKSIPYQLKEANKKYKGRQTEYALGEKVETVNLGCIRFDTKKQLKLTKEQKAEKLDQLYNEVHGLEKKISDERTGIVTERLNKKLAALNLEQFEQVEVPVSIDYQ